MHAIAKRDTRCTNVDGYDDPPVDRQSLQHLVDFLDNVDSHKFVVIAELHLYHVLLFSDPSDVGLNVLTDFIGRSDTTLTRVVLWRCNFGSQEDASKLLPAFHTNRTITDLTIHQIRNLEGTAMGNSLSSLLQNMLQLQRLDCVGNHLL
jgi:hypothetical protein